MLSIYYGVIIINEYSAPISVFKLIYCTFLKMLWIELANQINFIDLNIKIVIKKVFTESMNEN